jgi:SAM-dependent methyltransferase
MQKRPTAAAAGPSSDAGTATSTDGTSALDPTGGAPIFFDQHSRYASCADALRGVLRAGDTVLDIGCGEARLLGRFLPGVAITYLDPLLASVAEGGRGAGIASGPGEGGSPAGDLLAGTFASLPDTGRRWDWIVAVDTLEHIPGAEREQFFATILDHARAGVILSGPCREDAAALSVDEAVDDTYRRKTGRGYPWLVEHMEFGLPVLTAIRARLEGAGLRVLVNGNGHAPWLNFLLPLFVCYLDEPEHVRVFQHLSEIFNKELYRYDHLEPCYRRIVVGSRRSMPIAPDRLPDTLATRDAASAAWSDFQKECIASLSRHADALVLRAQTMPERELEDQVSDLNRWVQMARPLIEELRLQCHNYSTELAAARTTIAARDLELARFRASLSWRLMAPFRMLRSVLAAVLRPGQLRIDRPSESRRDGPS